MLEQSAKLIVAGLGIFTLPAQFGIVIYGKAVAAVSLTALVGSETSQSTSVRSTKINVLIDFLIRIVTINMGLPIFAGSIF